MSDKPSNILRNEACAKFYILTRRWPRGHSGGPMISGRFGNFIFYSFIFSIKTLLFFSKESRFLFSLHIFPPHYICAARLIFSNSGWSFFAHFYEFSSIIIFWRAKERNNNIIGILLRSYQTFQEGV